MLHFWQEPGGLVGRGFDFGQMEVVLMWIKEQRKGSHMKQAQIKAKEVPGDE